MKIAFIIINFHSDKDTLSLLSQLSNCTLPPKVTSVIYVVDNSRSSELKQKIKEYRQAVYVESPGNVGFATGNNLGIKQALKNGSDILVFINNDTLVSSDIVKNILASPLKDPQVGAVGGLIYFAKGFEFEKKYSPQDLGKVIWYAGGKIDWNNVYTIHLGVNEVDKGQFSGVYETDFITGCLFAIRSEVIRQVGGFAEKYCLYFEDSDLGMRLQQAGYRLVVDTKIKIWHKVAQSSGIGSPLNDYFLTRNRLVFGLDYASWRTKIALLREAVRKLFVGTQAQKQAIRDFFMRKLGKGSWLK